MSAGELQLHHLIGRRVHDREGRTVGRIEELAAEIEVHESDRDYVVTHFDVGHYGALDPLAGSLFVQGLLRLMGGAIGYRRYDVRWDQIDLRDPRRPVLTVDRSALGRGKSDAERAEGR